MPGPLAWFAEHQPFTPIIETMRGLLFGTPIGDNGLLAVAWCVVISVGRVRLGPSPLRPHASAHARLRHAPDPRPDPDRPTLLARRLTNRKLATVNQVGGASGKATP